tara:strand:- start:2853 stop:6389 length:3537 start_codon:yes stop_codon:yes gene_type:complete
LSDFADQFSLINTLQNQLIEINQRSIFVNALPRKSRSKIDLINLIDDNPTHSINLLIEDLVELRPFSIKLSINKSHQAADKRDSILYNLVRKATIYKYEFNLEPLGIGYPLLKFPNQKNNSFQYVPIFIWEINFKATLYKSNSLQLIHPENASVYLNPSLLKIEGLKEQLGGLKEEQIRNEIIDSEELKSLLGYFITRSSSIFSSQKLALLPLESPPLNTPVETENIEFDIVNNGVLGMYIDAKESLMQDYKKLMEETIPVHFSKPKLGKNEVFSGLLLDHSQQSVIRAMNTEKKILIHGPPGTGKSMTLTAALMYSLSRGQRCLVVCEKITAMDVIFQNLVEKGFGAFCIKLLSATKDRRSLVNKARDLILEGTKENELFSKTAIKSPSLFDLAKQNQIIEKNKKELFNYIDNVAKVKRGLEKKILEQELSTYNDIVIKLFSIKNEASSNQLKLNPKNFSFNANEWKKIEALFEYLNDFKTKHFNPYLPFLKNIDQHYLQNSRKDNFLSSCKEIASTYLNLIEGLIIDFNLVYKNLNSFEIKYLNFIPSNDSKINQKIKSVKELKHNLATEGLLKTSFFNDLNGYSPLDQLIQLKEQIEALNIMENYFTPLNEYCVVIEKKSAQLQTLAEPFFSSKTFMADFMIWYFNNLLSNSHVSNFELSENQKEKNEMLEKHEFINEHLLLTTQLELVKRRKKSILAFKRKYIEQTIEQFFSKRSVSNRTKKSLRDIAQHPSKILYNFFPIMFVNPTTAAQLFPMERGFFDVVLFDEASQVRLEDSYSILLRGKQQLVAGDEKQLSPTNYFKPQLKSISGKESIQLPESLFFYCQNTSFKDHYLDIHYRSQNPDLIQFSNHAFYDQRLMPMPAKKKYAAIEFFNVEGNFINRINKQEAEKIVDYLEKKVASKLSIGIATFSLSQQDAILNLIDIRTRKNPLFSRKMKNLKKRGFFVKNLENIQGEERDLILISSTYGKGKDNKYRAFLGQINNSLRGGKMLNVLVTRAKIKMVVFNSVPLEILEKYKLYIENEGLQGKALFYTYLSYAKAVNDKNNEMITSILHDLAKEKRADFDSQQHLRKLNKFNNYLVNELRKENIKIAKFTSNFKLGGFNYDLLLQMSRKKKLLLDFNGKLGVNPLEDFLFDLQKKKIASQQGYIYYRLWISNLFNSNSLELKKIKSILN